MQTYYEMKTSKGIMRGYYHKPDLSKYPICLIFHGFTGLHTGTKFSYVTLSRMLEKAGIGTIRLDFLGSGDSDLSFEDMTFQDELECALLLIHKVKAMPEVSSLYLLGHSMGGAIASECAKRVPHDIDKLCLWAPAFNLPQAVDYLVGQAKKAPYYDHNGFKISDEFVRDMLSRDFYQDLDIYDHDLRIIHGTKDTTVPYSISEKYLKGFTHPQFYPIEGGTHNFDSLKHIEQVIEITYDFFTNRD